MNDFQRRYYERYCAYLGLDCQKPVQAYVDRELSVQYPVVLKQTQEHLIVGVARQIADACGPIEQQISPQAGIGEVIRFLFDDQIAYTPDESYIAALPPDTFAPAAPSPEATLRLLDRRDVRALRAVEKTLTRQEKLLAQVSLRDEMVMGLFVDAQLVSAASLLRWNEIRDVGVMTRGDLRGRGYGAMAVSALCRIALDAGYLVQYRADQTNAASVALMHKLGFQTQMQIHGAVIRVKGEGK